MRYADVMWSLSEAAKEALLGADSTIARKRQIVDGLNVRQAADARQFPIATNVEAPDLAQGLETRQAEKAAIHDLQFVEGR